MKAKLCLNVKIAFILRKMPRKRFKSVTTFFFSNLNLAFYFCSLLLFIFFLGSEFTSLQCQINPISAKCNHVNSIRGFCTGSIKDSVYQRFLFSDDTRSYSHRFLNWNFTCRRIIYNFSDLTLQKPGSSRSPSFT